MRVLVLNSGSSSIKFRLFDMLEGESARGQETGRTLLRGAVKGIGREARLEIAQEGSAGSTDSHLVHDHAEATQWALKGLETMKNNKGTALLTQVEAVGHRVVHGGEQFSQAVLINDEVLTKIEMLSELAPLHNPASLQGIHATRTALGSTMPMVAVFDTAFHQTLPTVARFYALPYDLAARHRIRRYGFHGIAHASLAAGYMAHTGRALEKDRLICLQLGNGCSVTAIAAGKSVETSMGFTPLEGLMMGTRSGDLDPSIVSYLAQREKVDATEVERWLNERSGLLGVSGRSNDMPELLHAMTHEQDERAKLSIELFCYRVRKYIGAYLAVLGGAEAVVFGGGIGENVPEIRARICEAMEWCGLRLDADRNRAAIDLSPGSAKRISRDGASLAAYVVAVDEETWIARETVRCLSASRR
jgi:acetate kinase